MNVNFRNFAIWLVILFMLMGLFQVFQSTTRNVSVADKSYTQFVNDVDAGSVTSVTIVDNIVQGVLKDGSRFETVIPQNTDIVSRLQDRGVNITAKEPESSPFWSILLSSWLPFLVIIGVWFFFIRQMQGGGRGGAMGFGKSRAKLLTETHGKVTFRGRRRRRRGQAGSRGDRRVPERPRQVPAAGRTHSARRAAGRPSRYRQDAHRARRRRRSQCAVLHHLGLRLRRNVRGVGASRVRDMFEQAKKNAPCIIFIDEIDAVGRHRGAGLGGGNDEREQTLNQLLVEMDGFEANEGIILIAATNTSDVLDPALLRPGRFDRQVVVPNPDVQGREKILKVHVRKVPLAPDVDLKVLARGTPGFSGADLMNLVNEGALLAARRNKRFVTMAEFEDAKDKLMMGAERRTLSLTDEDKKLTAITKPATRCWRSRWTPPIRSIRRRSSRAAARWAW